ncbi:hypothetical protein HanIR_Chr02g0097801 [Helianthus annuus]|nr:hypothetical protein HanIR_Chr02g0097801 [Helianthus annuus]
MNIFVRLKCTHNHVLCALFCIGGSPIGQFGHVVYLWWLVFYVVQICITILEMYTQQCVVCIIRSLLHEIVNYLIFVFFFWL